MDIDLHPRKPLQEKGTLNLSPYRRWFATVSPALRFCVVGSGPAGFYTASQLLKRYGDAAAVDIVDRLPTPFGLVRSGVAPDHPGTKNVINQFTEVGRDPRVAFLGNVRLGRDVSLKELRSFYNAVILAYGAESDRRLGITGEGLRGVFSAREFVWWYNGHPDYVRLPIDLSQVRRVVVIGLGNVAVDCARILLQPPERLARTDITQAALSQLRNSAVQRVDLVGRRGPVQASFTAKELREIINMEGLRVVVPPESLALSPGDQAELKASRRAKRVYELLSSAAADSQPQLEGQRELHIDFLRSPLEVIDDGTGSAAGVRLAVNRLEPAEGTGSGPQRAVPTGETEELPAELVLKSIGYAGLPVEGLAFDEKRGVAHHKDGHVLQPDNRPEEGLYVCGWLKRGPTGIIGTNLVDAEETVEAIVRDTETLPNPTAALAGSQGLRRLLASRGVQVVGFPQWLELDKLEVERGAALGKPREKLVDVVQMLSVCQEVTREAD
eukprot:jgi/Botrbrau1/12613/Bobra.0169s0140.1